jgi:3-oxoadipate CoA-transferase, alpha subunit
VIDKVVASPDESVRDVFEGATLLSGGFGRAGIPLALIPAVARLGVRKLTVVSNNLGMGIPGDLGELFQNGQVSRVFSSFPLRPGSDAFRAAYDRGEIELNLVPQGTLSERIRAAGAGIGGFYTPTGVGTLLAEGKEVREIDGRRYVLETPLSGDFALVHAYQADRWGNLRFRGGARNFNPVMAMAGKVTIAEVEELVPLGGIDPEGVHCPGIFVDRVVVVGRR